ncbi:5'-nucleotidase domain-containing protein 1 [Liparis tanakae]|uniref:5'-nucleotidase domain-containing protein 1 n=1 Tax=Liparis tanakae TaxID=230148 RepID=A0A4Z2J680_9TELE|nr:5'-nucleotidase domain-containing protein 1 [Liparis tanakae]
MSEYFSLSDSDVIGFDLDHTLCRYHLKETSRVERRRRTFTSLNRVMLHERDCSELQAITDGFRDTEGPNPKLMFDSQPIRMAWFIRPALHLSFLLSHLIYESFARYLVEHKGYDKDLLNLTPATWDFCFKGLVVDLEDGNLVKLAEDGTVLRATHGTNDLSTEDIIKHYGPKREWKHFNSLNTSFTRSAKYYFYDNYFDLPGALLCGRVVDMLRKRGNEVNSDFWKDMVAAIDHNYNTAAFKDAITFLIGDLDVDSVTAVQHKNSTAGHLIQEAFVVLIVEGHQGIGTIDMHMIAKIVEAWDLAGLCVLLVLGHHLNQGFLRDHHGPVRPFDPEDHYALDFLKNLLPLENLWFLKYRGILCYLVIRVHLFCQHLACQLRRADQLNPVDLWDQ